MSEIKENYKEKKNIKVGSHYNYYVRYSEPTKEGAYIIYCQIFINFFFFIAKVNFET
jgi:hypothetical protein